MLLRALFFLLLFFSSYTQVLAAINIPFSVAMSEIVTVTGSPRLTLTVGSATRYATYTTGSGTNTLTFTYSVTSGDVDLDGISITPTIDLNGGTITDAAGNMVALAFTPPNTSGIKINAAVPSGYTVSFSADTATNQNKTNMAFSFLGAKIGTTYNYTISSSGGGTPLSGTGTVSAASETVSGINLTSLSDGLLTLSFTLTDSLGGIGAAATDTLPYALLDNSLIGHWTFDSGDISGTTAYDRSGQSNNGSIFNGPVAIAGKAGQALSFDGVDDYVSITRNAGLEPSAFTISAWVQFLQLDYSGSTGKLIFIAAKGQPDSAAGPANYGWWFSYDNRSNGSNFAYTCFGNTGGGFAGGGNNFGASGYRKTFSTAAYHLFTLVVTSTESSMYIDGVLNYTAKTLTNTNIADTTRNLFLARHGSGGYYSKENLDDVRFYNRALSASEVATLYNVTK